MSQAQIPQYQIPLELLDAFQIQWQAYKSMQEYADFVKSRPELAQLGDDPNFGQALSLLGTLLGEDLSQSLTAILTAMGEAYQRRNAPAGG